MNVLQPEPLPFDAERVDGLSSRLLRSHHVNNYGGAVKRLNAIRGELAGLDYARAPGFVLNGLKREELIATNSMVLHELYFASIAHGPQTLQPAWQLALEANFGSVDAWREQFVACGKALAGGSGWVLLSFNPREGTLVNQWAADHTHAIAGAVPLLALDMYEHAYHLDYGADTGVYVQAFMRNIAWNAVYERYQHAVHAASEPLACPVDEAAACLLLDVRRQGVWQQATEMAEGASWRNPAQVDRWAKEFEDRDDVVVYCVYGHEVGRATAMQLRARGVRARFMAGGFEGWQRAGRPLQAKLGGNNA